jgi:hypothetical protein
MSLHSVPVGCAKNAKTDPLKTKNKDIFLFINTLESKNPPKALFITSEYPVKEHSTFLIGNSLR